MTDVLVEKEPVNREKKKQILDAAQKLALPYANRTWEYGVSETAQLKREMPEELKQESDKFIEAMQAIGGWDEKDAEEFRKSLPEIGISLNDLYEKEREIKEAAVEVTDYEKREHPTAASSYAEAMKLKGEWTPENAESFFRYRNEILGKGKFEESLLQERIAELYSKELEKGYAPGRAVAMGIVQTERDIGAMLTRPFSSKKADEILNDTNLMSYAQSKIASNLEMAATGATRSISFGLPVGAVTGGWGVLGAFALNRGNQAITEANNAGLTGFKRVSYIGTSALIEGGIAGAFQALGAGGFEKIISGGITASTVVGLLKEGGFHLAAELIEENSTEFVDLLNQKLHGVDPTELTLDQLISTFTATTAQTVLAAGAPTALQGMQIAKTQYTISNLKNNLIQNYGFDKRSVDLAVRRAFDAEEKGGSFEKVLGREIEKQKIKSAEGAILLAQQQKKQAQEIAGRKVGQKEWRKRNLPRMTEKERSEVTKNVEGAVEVVNRIEEAEKEAQSTLEKEGWVEKVENGQRLLYPPYEGMPPILLGVELTAEQEAVEKLEEKTERQQQFKEDILKDIARTEDKVEYFLTEQEDGSYTFTEYDKEEVEFGKGEGWNKEEAADRALQRAFKIESEARKAPVAPAGEVEVKEKPVTTAKKEGVPQAPVEAAAETKPEKKTLKKKPVGTLPDMQKRLADMGFETAAKGLSEYMYQKEQAARPGLFGEEAKEVKVELGIRGKYETEEQELLAMRNRLQELGLEKEAKEVTDYLKEKEKVQQGELFAGPMFEESQKKSLKKKPRQPETPEQEKKRIAGIKRRAPLLGEVLQRGGISKASLEAAGIDTRQWLENDKYSYRMAVNTGAGHSIDVLAEDLINQGLLTADESMSAAESLMNALLKERGVAVTSKAGAVEVAVDEAKIAKESQLHQIEQVLAEGGMTEKQYEAEVKKIENAFKNARRAAASGGAEVYYYTGELPETGINQDRESNEASPLVFGMPDLIELLESSGAKMPKIYKQLSRRGALGLFRGSTETIELKADIFIGPVLKSGLIANNEETIRLAKEVITGKILSQFPELKPEDIEVRTEIDKKTRKLRITFYKKDPTFARRVFAHEIGHWVDFMPEGSLKRGNILGHLASLKRYLKATIGALAKDVKEHLTSEDQRRIRKEAQKEAGKEPSEKAKLEAWRKNVNEIYKKRVAAEVKRRGLISRNDVMKELMKLTLWWKPFDPSTDPNYTKYRFSPAELYADALSVLLNNPAALKKRAPTFYHSFFSYFENNPEVRDSYNAITEEIRVGASGTRSRARVRESLIKGDEAHRVELEKMSTPVSTIREAIGSYIADRFYKLERMVKHAKKTLRGKEQVNPNDAIDVARYSGSQIEHYANQVYDRVTTLLEKNNLTPTDLGEYLVYMRAINERSTMANPIVGDKAGAEQALQAMRTEMGEAAMDTLEEARKSFREIREKLILARLEDLGIYDKKFMKFLKDNDYYATFEVVEYINGKYGKSNGIKMFKQIGTFKGVSNPLSATMQTDISLLRSMNWNDARKETADFLMRNYPGEIEEAETKWKGDHLEFLDTGEKGKGLLTFLRDGKLEGYYIDSSTADAFTASFNEDFHRITKALRLIAQPARMWFTNIRPGFQLFNTFFRDPLRSISNIPGLGLKPWVMYKNLFTSLTAVAKDNIFGRPDPVLEEMRQKGLLISWSNLSGLDGYDTQTERLFAKYSSKDLWDKNITNPFKRWLSRFTMATNFLLKVGNVGEHANKRAGYIYLKKNQAKYGWTDQEVDHMTRHWVGSPSFITGGKATPLTNNLLLFSNAMIQGWRSDIEAFREHPLQVGTKKFVYSITPKMLMFGFASGALASILKAMGAPDDDPAVKFAEDMKKVLDRASSYDMANYTVIPLGLDENKKGVYLRIPQDETGRIIGGMFYKLISGENIISNAKDVLRYMGDQGAGFNPALECGLYTLQYLTGTNPYDAFRRREAVPETEWKAGGLAAHKAFGKWLWNNYGGSFIYKFRYKNPADTKTEVESFLQLPFMGDIAGRFVKVTDYGLTEKAKEAKKKAEKERAREILRIRDLVKRDMDKQELTHDEEKMLQESKYADRYRKMLDVRGGEQVESLIDIGKTDKEKKAILDAVFSDRDDPAVQKAIDDFIAKKVYEIGDPIKRKRGEKKAAYEKRKAQREKEIAEAIGLIKDYDLDKKKIFKAIRKRYKSGRMITKDKKRYTAYGLRIRNIKKRLNL